MHDDRVERGVRIEPELENRQTRERRDPQALRVVEHHALHGLEVLLVQEQQHEIAQPLLLIGAQAAEGRRGRDGRSPQVIRDRVAGENAPPAPAFQHEVTERAALEAPPRPLS